MFLTYFFNALDVSSYKTTYCIISKFYPDLRYFYEIRDKYENLLKLKVYNYGISEFTVTQI